MNIFESIEEDINERLIRKNKLIKSNLNKQELLFQGNDNFKNHFYFENLTDDCFFDLCGAKKEFTLFYNKIIKSKFYFYSDLLPYESLCFYSTL